jgi:hypothetical protein
MWFDTVHVRMMPSHAIRCLAISATLACLVT